MAYYALLTTDRIPGALHRADSLQRRWRPEPPHARFSGRHRVRPIASSRTCRFHGSRASPSSQRHATITCLLLLLACGPAPSSLGSEAALRGTLARYDSAWAAKDTATVQRILAPDYVYFTSNGGLSTRTESLGFLVDTGYVLTLSRRSEVQVALAGPTGRVSSRWEGLGRFHNDTVRDDQTCGQTWLRREGQWLLFTEHCVNRPLRDSSPSPPS
jgi:hypothetical protein